MIHLRVRTEYAFNRAFGRIEEVLAHAGGNAMAITDPGCWGHVAFSKAAKARGLKPLLGVELELVSNAALATRQYGRPIGLLARTDAGLRELYQMVSRANTKPRFYYTPRIDGDDLAALSDNVIILAGPGNPLTLLPERAHVYLTLQPGGGGWNQQALRQSVFPVTVACDNAYVTPEDRAAYEMTLINAGGGRTTPRHLLSPEELQLAMPEVTRAMLDLTQTIADGIDVHLPRAAMVRYPDPVPLAEQCQLGAARLGINLADPTYGARLAHELRMIGEKQFEDYFYVIADMVTAAKQRMLVGPARGSSAGSLVCYLIGITDVDPIKHDLMFERFIDVTRSDLPDIDIDFPDLQREHVITQLVQKYGAARVGRIGTINRYKAKSALGDVAKTLGIPAWELADFSGAIIERSTGDARAQFAIADAFELDVGKAIVAKYPGLTVAARLEGHARHSGMHAAGVLVTDRPITDYCAVDYSGAAQLDKKDAEVLNLLKIDALGLRTLTVLEDVLHQLGKPHDWLRTYPLEDAAAFGVLNAERFAGIFQFEGYALQSLTRQMKVKNFNDIVAITSLARPGPLHSGAANEFVQRRIGAEPVTYLHPLAEPSTRESYGIVIYQEQVMTLTRVIGQLNWEDVNQLRRAMSKSLGDEFFSRYWARFEAGAATLDIPSAEAKRIWDKICTFGSWAFNKSHAVSYGLISYWCAMLKAHWPLEFAAACLRRAKDEDQSIKLLRELAAEGMTFRAVDPDRSGLEWAVVDGMLVGGLTNITGVGRKKAEELIARRAAGTLTPAQQALLLHPATPYDDLFEAERRWGALYGDLTQYPVRHEEELDERTISIPVPGRDKPVVLTCGPDGKPPRISKINTINEHGTYCFVAKLVEKNLRDVNEYGTLTKRGGERIERNPNFLNLVLEDDSGSIIATVGRFDYARLGKPLVETGRLGDWYLVKGEIKNQWRKVYIHRLLRLGAAGSLKGSELSAQRRETAMALKMAQQTRAKEQKALAATFKQEARRKQLSKGMTP
jgi:DNA polymerase III alpha subunit